MKPQPTKTRRLPRALLAATLAVGALVAFTTGARQETLERFDAIDFAGVTGVRVEGPGSEVIVTAGRSSAYSASVDASGWSARWCGARAAVDRDGGDLRIRIDRNVLAPPFGCDLLLRLAVPEGLAVTIRQDATVARFSGRFGALRVESPKAIVTLAGGADSVDVDSEEALVDHANAAGAARTRIAADKLVADIGLPSDVRVAWRVDAPVSVFRSAYPNDASGEARVEIRSRFLKGSIYRLPAAS